MKTRQGSRDPNMCITREKSSGCGIMRAGIHGSRRNGMQHLSMAALLAGAISLGLQVAHAAGPAPRSEGTPSAAVRTLTSGPKHHFFGYYGIDPWNQSGSALLCLETDFQDHVPSPDEPAAIGLVDAKTGAFGKITETRAWNFQQGAMLHWDPRDRQHRILFNDRRDGRIVSVSMDVRSRRRRYLPRAISAVSHDGKHALSLTYGRLRRLRPVVGYRGSMDPNPRSPNPDNDGVFLMDLATGRTRLVVPIAKVYGLLLRKHRELRRCHMWFNHTVFNADDTRFLFLARARVRRLGGMTTAMFTANTDGSDLREVIPFGKGVSHFDWRNKTEIIATFRLDGRKTVHVLFTDGRDDYRQIGPGFLVGDGHCTFAPDRQWLVTDPRTRQLKARRLQVFNVETEKGAVLGEFPLGRHYTGELRCDLHPRWNRTGKAICFDAPETKGWTRQLHVAELDFGR